MTAVRPIYVGVGTCNCQRTDVRLYQLPGGKNLYQLYCERCLANRGHEVPKPRTAEDIEIIDGVPRWKT